MQLFNDSTSLTPTQYFIVLASGQEIGPYPSFEQARLSAATMPVIEGFQPQIVPKTHTGASILLG